jgi:hypothetical protein
MRSIALVSAAVLLASCQTLSYDGNENSPYFVVPAGSRLTLTQALTIAPDQVGLFLQDGRVTPFAEIRKYYPHCKFELYRRVAEARTVSPDAFTISRPLQEETHSVSNALPMYARVSLLIRADADIDGGPSIRSYATRMNLRSEKQPEVFRLSCGQWGHPPDTTHVTIAEMRRALGSVFELELAPK